MMLASVTEWAGEWAELGAGGLADWAAGGDQMGQAQGPVGGQVTMVEVNNERRYVCAVHWLSALCGALNGCTPSMFPSRSSRTQK